MPQQEIVLLVKIDANTESLRRGGVEMGLGAYAGVLTPQRPRIAAQGHGKGTTVAPPDRPS